MWLSGLREIHFGELLTGAPHVARFIESVQTTQGRELWLRRAGREAARGGERRREAARETARETTGADVHSRADS